MLAQDFHAYGTLACNHVGVVKGMDEAQFLHFLQQQGMAIGIVVAVSLQHDFDRVFTKMPDGINFELGRGNRHHDDRFAAQFLRGQGYTLCVIASRSGNHAAFELLRRQLRHLVISTPKFEREHRLHVFALQKNRIADARRQAGSRFQWGLDGYIVDTGGENTLEITLHRYE